MIFTSFAAAALVAITGMTTVRSFDGTQQQVEIKPNVAYELTVANISNPKGFLYELGNVTEQIQTSISPKGSFGQGYNRKANIAAKRYLQTLKIL